MMNMVLPMVLDMGRGTGGRTVLVRLCCAVPLVLFAAAAPIHGAELPARGTFLYFSQSQCIAASKLPRHVCNYADVNSRAEFAEKMETFPTRAACERKFSRGRCSIASLESAGARGKGRRVSFMPQREGFKIVVHSPHNVTVIPRGPRGPISFRTRSALRLEASRSVKFRQQLQAKSAPSPGIAGSTLNPGRNPGFVPPVLSSDPNFKCSDIVVAAPGEDPRKFCYPARRK